MAKPGAETAGSFRITAFKEAGPPQKVEQVGGDLAARTAALEEALGGQPGVLTPQGFVRAAQKFGADAVNTVVEKGKLGVS